MDIHEQIKKITEDIKARESNIRVYQQEIKSRRCLIEQERQAIEELKWKRHKIMFSSFKEH
mgnify:CR=1 FL=1